MKRTGRFNESGSVVIESTIFVSAILLLLISTLSIVTSIREKHKLIEALSRSALHIMRLTSTYSESSIPERAEMRCLVLIDIVRRELKRENITQGSISIDTAENIDGLPAQQTIQVELPRSRLVGSRTAMVQVSTPQFSFPVDCGRHGTIELGL